MKNGNTQTATTESTTPPVPETTSETPLKRICAELKMDPKKARRILRKYWRKEGTDISHKVRERWQGDEAFSTQLRNILAPTKH